MPKSTISLILITTVLLNFNGRCQAGTGPKVTVAQGQLEGRTVTARTGVLYDSFQGIPYALPPVGNLRFKDPQPAKNWDGIFNATVVGNACPQYDSLYLNKYTGNEDCLTLNVYVPKRNITRPMPVIIWIHGGAFTLGDGSPMLHGPDYAMTADAIYVTFNYRLGALGFLSLQNCDIPGNAGLKDQSMAIKWVANNIKDFGGDNQSIMLYGQDAGAASTHYQILSPMSKGLFQRAALLSGSSFNPWALQKEPLTIAHTLATELGIDEKSKNLGDSLREIPIQDLVMASVKPSLTGKVRLSFAPVVEKESPHVTPFITSPPQKIMESGNFNKVMIVIGLNQNNGLQYRTKSFGSPEAEKAIANKQIPDLKPYIPDEVLKRCNEDGINKVINKLKEKYFPPNSDFNKDFTNLLSDFAYVRGIVSSVQAFAKYSPVYFYRFSFVGSIDLMSKITDLKYTGSSHLAETAYSFDIALNGINKLCRTKADTLMTNQIQAMLYSIAKFANPTPPSTSQVPVAWKPSTANETLLFDIDAKYNVISKPYADQMDFWEEISKMCIPCAA